jgi:hypothetical protein
VKAVFGDQSEFDQKVIEALGCQEAGTADMSREGQAEFRLDEVSVVGGCDEGAVREVVGLRTAVFLCCYERELKANPTRESSVYARWRIGEDGVMSSLAMGPSHGEARPLFYCIGDLSEPMTFGEVSSRCEVEATFTCTPELVE